MLAPQAFLRVGVAIAAALLFAAPRAEAVVLIDTDFSAAEGYNDAVLQFQQPTPTEGGAGIWLGQGTTEVDTSGTGTVQGRGGFFLRNGWSLGARGTLLGLQGQSLGDPENTIEQGPGFVDQGDIIKVTSDFQFTLPDNGNAGIYNFGVTDCFAACGFSPSPRAGVESGWNGFAQGAYKVFSNYGRNSNSGPDNAFGLLLSGPDIGIMNGFDADNNPIPDAVLDFESDLLRIEFVAELTDVANNVWTTTDLIVTNLDTQTVIADAKVDKPAALETWVWNSTTVDDPFTDAIETGMAGHPTTPGSDMWLGALWVPDGDSLNETNVDRLRFEYVPINPPAGADGDYNDDGVVDAIDYAIWRESNGQLGADLPADGNNDGAVDEMDFEIWKNNYGATAPASAAVATPEPAGVMILGLAAAAGLVRRRA